MSRGVVVMAYGSPRSRDDIAAYYTDIRRGRPPSAAQLAELTRRYDAIGGASPLGERTEAQRVAIARALDRIEADRFDVAVGLRHAAPSIEEAVTGLADRGAERIVGLVLAPHYSSMSVAAYHRRAAAEAGARGVQYRGIESWATDPAYVQFLAADIRARLGSLPARTHVVFTAHSLPARILDTHDRYPDELKATAAAVADAVGLAGDSWSVAWQSAAMTPERWLEPDVRDVIDRLPTDGWTGVLVCPCGFVSDHLEVLYDLDVDAKAHADAAGVQYQRTTSVNDNPNVMSALAQLVVATGR
jgi:protoporphyrin/coproporphyrin ferrochelatase